MAEPVHLTWNAHLRDFRRRVFRSQSELADALSKLQIQLSDQARARLSEVAIDPSTSISYATISRYETTQVPGRRSRHLYLIWGLVQLGCIFSIDEANAWLAQATQMPLRGDEVSAIFGDEAHSTRLEKQHVSSLSPRHNLPVELTPLIGREEEVRELSNHLLDIDHHLVAIIGMGGMGKTHIAIALGHKMVEDAANHFPDGVWLVPLAELEAQDAAAMTTLTNAIVETLELPFTYMANVEEQLVEYLASKRMLLILDNLENLLEGVPILVRLLRAAPGLKILATSRTILPLLTATEMVSLSGLAVPESTGVQDCTQFGSVQLFLAQVRRRNPGFGPDGDDLNGVVQLCKLLGGMPLTIILAASWVPHLSISEILDEVCKGLDLLTADALDMPPRHRSIRVVLTHSWETLPRHLQQILARLGVFRRGFSRHAAETVTGCKFQDLVKLTDLSLIARSSTGGYSMHELLRWFALEKLDAIGERESYIRLHAKYYLEWLHKQDSRLRSPEMAKAIAEVRSELDNIRVAWEWAVNNAGSSLEMWSAIAGASWALSCFYEEVMLTPEAELRLHQAVQAIGSTVDKQGQTIQAPTHLVSAQLLAQWARYLVHIGEFTQAQGAAEAALTLCTRFANSAIHRSIFLRTQVCASYASGRAYASQGLVAKALTTFEKGWRLAQKADLPYDGLDHQVERAILALDRSDYTVAQAEFESARRLAQTLGDRGRLISTATHLSRVLFERGDFAAAKSHTLHTIAAQTHPTYGPSGWTTNLMNTAGWIAHRMGEDIEARHYYEQALVIARQSGTPWNIARALRGLAWAAFLNNDYQIAESLFAESRERLHEIDHRKDYAVTENNLGFMLDLRGNHPLALQYFSQALAMFRTLGKRYSVANTLVNMAFSQLAMGDTIAAKGHLDESLSVARTIGARAILAEAVAGYARLHLALQDVESSVYYLAVVRADQYACHELFETRLNPLERELTSAMGREPFQALLAQPQRRNRPLIPSVLDEIVG